MYSYQINNSYIVYVNYAYINECIKASHSYSSNSKAKKTSTVCTMPIVVKSTAKVGSKVEVLNLDTQKKDVFTIAYSRNIDVANGIISDVSPIGSSLIGHSVGDMITVKVPSGTIKYKIIGLRS